jgi:hypothetical protein
MKSILPIILVVLLLTGAITYSLAKRAIPKREENRFGISANELKGKVDEALTPTPTQKAISGLIATPTPTATVTVTPTPTKAQTPTSMPTVSEEKDGKTKGGVATKTVTKTTKTTKTTVCTPVYGMANTCTEHVVVDTGAADSIFFNFAGLAYVAGLASFIKAKTLKK